MVTIGHASISEKGTANGKPGDQTGREVVTRSWYNKPWIAVFRPKNAKDAEKIAKAMEQACANDCVGYSQDSRTTFYHAAKELGFKIDKIKKKVNTDCSACVAVCVNAAGIKVSKDMYTGNESEALMKTGRFEKLTASKYTADDSLLKRGDILLAKGHTAVALTDGDGVKGAAKTAAKATAKTSTKKGTKSAAEIAREVADGKWGNGDARKAKLEAAGYNYKDVQVAVNKLLK